MPRMEADLAAVAALIADPSRAAMLNALNGGMPFTAGELARAAGVAPSTATGHLDAAGARRAGRLGARAAGRGTCGSPGRRWRGRWRRSPRSRRRCAAGGLKAWQHGEALRAARSCYDHLAGVAGVALADALVDARLLEPGRRRLRADRTRARTRWARSGSTSRRILGARRATARACLDWSERRPHVGGALGAALFEELLRRRWLRRRPDGRALTVTGPGRTGLASPSGSSSPRSAPPSAQPSTPPRRSRG